MTATRSLVSLQAVFIGQVYSGRTKKLQRLLEHRGRHRQ